MIHAHRVSGHELVHLNDIEPDAPADLTRKQALNRLAELGKQLSDLQKLLYAASEHAVLVVLQGLDASGKDGTIRHVFRFLDPQGCRIEAFKSPTSLELSRDFLWRVHRAVPEKGMVAVFNRSHYEDVLIGRVRSLVPDTVWQRRYDHINAFERLLTDNGTIILKFYLHISHEEQEERLRARERDVAKAWKLSAADWDDRDHWQAYITAYEDVFRLCSSDQAPWYIIPANRKWYRNLAVADVLLSTLLPYREQWLATLAQRGEREMAAIREMRASLEDQPVI